MVHRSTGPSSRTSAMPGTPANASGGGGDGETDLDRVPGLSRSVARLSAISSRPDRMIATRSATCSTSDSTCEDSITAAPASTRSRSRWWNSCWISGSSPLVGSSSSSRSGSPSRASSSPAFCRFPLDSSRTGRSRSTSRRLARSVTPGSWSSPRSRARCPAVSRAVSRGHSRTSPGRYPVRACTATRSRQASRPCTRAEPAVGRRNPISSRSVVVLPAPFGPRKPSTSPARTSSVSRSSASSRPYRFVSDSVRTTAGSVICPTASSCWHPVTQRRSGCPGRDQVRMS